MRVVLQKKYMGIQYQTGTSAEGKPKFETKSYQLMPDAIDANVLEVATAIAGLCQNVFSGVEKTETSNLEA